MTIHFRALRAMAVSDALLAPGASIALADSPGSLQAGSPALEQTVPASRAVVANNGLCGAQYGVPMADCDHLGATRHAAGDGAGAIDYQGFPYNLPDGG
jgi:hypothetical protein